MYSICVLLLSVYCTTYMCMYICILSMFMILQCGFAPIHCAARGNHIQCVTLLLQSGACHVNEKTEFGENPFVIACLNGSVTVARSAIATAQGE